ncbi:peptide-methionine (S)-S-oxide reductase [Vibrio sp. 10N.286.49.B3]|uniref:peptide-methionine (S)-S-oxide reductase MsrA n=1 Tax=Vibrio sp. 10N.286.49.B3 TaxID=1880855 RepID=UPI000C85AD4B|nr:peptide-methionine (S)-S-oxide reductase MsrA [Vibrio sp. 10N.286.49.B3]PMH42550.1 peptide-methionine (S)-S-oxide reductase [Vibrio sp. 10N.286.49.B3]
MTNKNVIVSEEQALAGRSLPIHITAPHFVNQSDLNAQPTPEQQQILVGMGCFWGAERLFWPLDGVISTSVGYAGGFTKNPNYEEVCSGHTGHAEVVRIIFDPMRISLRSLLELFWQRHDPTQGMRQGNDLGTQYRSVIYTYNSEQMDIAQQTKQDYQQALDIKEKDVITTQIEEATTYYFAEDYHQQYLAKNPTGYCGLGGTGVCFLP